VISDTVHLINNKTWKHYPETNSAAVRPKVCRVLVHCALRLFGRLRNLGHEVLEPAMLAGAGKSVEVADQYAVPLKPFGRPPQ
jgi:hypothetical protein